MTKTDWAVCGFIFACVSSIAAGVILAVMYDNPAWLLLCAPVVVFLS